MFSAEMKRDLDRQIADSISEFEALLRAKITWLNHQGKSDLVEKSFVKLYAEIEDDFRRFFELRIKKRNLPAEVIWMLDRRYRLKCWRQAINEIRLGFYTNFLPA